MTISKSPWFFGRIVKRPSIKAKILIAELSLSLLPLVLFVAIGYPGIVYVQERMGRGDLLRLAEEQATIVRIKLEKITDIMRMSAFEIQALLNNPSAFAQERSYSAAEKSANPNAAVSSTLAPGVSTAAAKPALELSTSLENVFAFVKESDPGLQSVYYGTQSGVYLEYPQRNEPPDSLEFTLDPALAETLSAAGEVSGPVRRAFSEEGLTLSPRAMISTTAPGSEWQIRNDDDNRIFSVRRGKTGLEVYLKYDPRATPWYRNAAGQRGVVWTKYADWSAPRFMFRLNPAIATQITGKVSPTLAQAFANRQITLVENSPVRIERNGTWRLRDKNGNDYEIRRENGQLGVYIADTLTVSQAVLDPEGHLAGVAGLDVGTFSGDCQSESAQAAALGACPPGYRKQLIYSPDPGYDFLLNDRGQLIDQQAGDMFIPPAGGGIRSEMTAGNTGVEYVPDSAAYVAYAPILSAGGKSFWSAGVSLPEAAITQITSVSQQRLIAELELAVGIIFVLTIVPVVFAAFRIAQGITGPIVELGTGVKRIGSGDLDHRVSVRTRDEIGDLANAFNKMAGDLQTYMRNLTQTTADKERLESELRLARDLQMSFLKTTFPAFPGRNDFSLNAAIEPAREVGGDLYDFDLVDDTRLVFYVGDVSDKGVPAALVMAETMTLMRLAYRQKGITPAGTLSQVNAALSTNNPNCMFVTLFIGILDLKTGELSFSNAGHNPPLILSANGESRFLALPDGLVLGVMADAEYRDDRVYLAPGDMILAYTDGVTEAMNPDRALYSEARLQQTLATMAGRSVGDAVAEIVASVRVHAAGAPQSDDITVLALRRAAGIPSGLPDEASQEVAAI